LLPPCLDQERKRWLAELVSGKWTEIVTCGAASNLTGMTKLKKKWIKFVLFGTILASIPTLASIPAQAQASLCGKPAADDDYEQLDQGFHALYDLDFAGGQHKFMAWETLHPRNPLGPAVSASGYLFQEFERLGVLKAEIFTDDRRFVQRNRPVPSVELKARFNQELAMANALADYTLAQDPQSPDALLAKTLVYGLKADYAGLIEKRNMAALSFTKEGRGWAERLLRVEPGCYDAYLALGAENYLVAIKPVVVRWFAKLGGAHANREEGVRELTLTAENGRFLKPFAKLLLVLVAQRDHDPAAARRLLAELQQEFPNNSVYRDELTKLDSRFKRPADSKGTEE
jgi:hypothetical protein